MKDYNLFKDIFSHFNAAFFGLKFKAFVLEQSKSLIGDGFIDTYQAKFESNNREIVIAGTVMNMDALIRNTPENKTAVLSDFLLNSKQGEIKRLKDEDAKKFFERSMSQIEQVFKSDLSGVLEGSKWIDVPHNWRGYK